MYVREGSNYASLAVSFFMNCKKRYMKIQVFLKLSVLKNVADFIAKHLRWETPVQQTVRPATWNFVKKRLQQKCFPVKFLRAPFSTKQFLWLRSKISNTESSKGFEGKPFRLLLIIKNIVLLKMPASVYWVDHYSLLSFKITVWRYR